MELDTGSEEFVVDALDRWVLYNPSLRSRYAATLENAAILLQLTLAAQEVHADIAKRSATTAPAGSPSLENARRRAEDAATRIPQILEVLSPFTSENYANDLEAFLNTEPNAE